jgi:ribosomal protein S14
MRRNTLVKDVICRKQVKLKELQRNIVKILIHRGKKFLNKNEKVFLYYLLNSFKKNSSIALLVNRCIITGRSKGIFRKFKLSRMELKKRILKGEVSNTGKY